MERSSKTCSGCARHLPAAEFHANRSSPDGLYSRCRRCKGALSATRRATPIAKRAEKERGRAYYEAHRETLLQKRRERYAANPARALAQNAEWRAVNAERHRALCRAWARNHPVAMRAIVATRRARIARADGRYTAADVRALFNAQDGRCPCGADLTLGYHVDHRIPIVRGGSNWPDNLQLLCPPCNRRKGAKLPHELGRASQPALR